MPTLPLEKVAPDRLKREEILWGAKKGFATVFPSQVVSRRYDATIIPAVSGDQSRDLEAYFADPKYSCARIAFARLKGVWVDGELGVCRTSMGDIIKETAHVAQMIEPSLASVIARAEPGSRYAHFESPVLHCFHRSTAAYGHFLFDCLASILFFSDVIHAGRLKILMPSYFPVWGVDILRSVGFDIESHVAFCDAPAALCDTIIIPECIDTTNTFRPNPDVCRYLGDIKVHGAHAPSKVGPLVYMSRSNQVAYSERRILNEDKVRSTLERLGYSVIEPGNMSFAAQVEAIRNAAVIIAPHGSSFGNLVFAMESASVIDLMPSAWVNFWDQPESPERWLFNLTAARNLRYTVLLCQSNIVERRGVSAGLQTRGIEYSVDLELLKRTASA